MIYVTTNILEQGMRNAVLQFTGISDGLTNETNVLKVDCAALLPSCKRVSVLKIDFDITDTGRVDLAWDTTIPIVFASLAGWGNIKYVKEGGLHHATLGNIVFSTVGFDVNSSYTIKLWLRKKYD